MKRKLLSALCFLVTACHPEPAGPPREQTTRRLGSGLHEGANAQLVAAVRGRTVRGFEDEILRMEARIPGLGGIFVDRLTGRPTVYLTPTANQDQALVVLRGMSRALRLRPAVRARLEAPGGIMVRQGKYRFSELVAWQELISRELRLEGYMSVDANEAINRVEIEHSGGRAGEDLILSTLAQLGVSVDAVEIRGSSGMRLLSGDLRDRSRPVYGGSQMFVSNGVDSGLCTIGFPVRVLNYDLKGWLTASHCDVGTNGDGVTGDDVYQSTVTGNDVVGEVTLNPPWDLTETACQSKLWCTRADVAFVQANDSTSSTFVMRIRATEEWNDHVSTNTRSPRTIPDGVGYWANIEPVPWVASGDTVYKVGRTTGVTGGWVSNTCKNEFIAYYAFLCFHEVRDASAGDGDSGSPVFYPSDVQGNPPYAIGIVNGALDPSGITFSNPDGSDFNVRYCIANCRWLFSEWGAIETHLSRYLSPRPAGSPGSSFGMSATIDGPTTTWQGAQQTWEVVPSGSDGPFWYYWAGFGGAVTGSQSSITATPNTGGLLEVLVWDAFGNYALASITVSWCGQYAC